MAGEASPVFVVVIVAIILIVALLFRFRLLTVVSRPIEFVEEEVVVRKKGNVLNELELSMQKRGAARGRDLGARRPGMGPGGRAGAAAQVAAAERGRGKAGGRPGQVGMAVGGGEALNITLSENAKRIEKILSRMYIPESQLLNSKHLASGGFADVFTCDWNDTRVAVKKMKPTLPPGELENFLTEMELMSKLHHPNLVRLIGCSFRPYFIVMQFISRGTLHELLHDQRTNLSWKIVRQFSLDIANALRYMHKMKTPMTHRDIKSGNILVDRDWTLKMTDFGLSKPEDPIDMEVKNVLGTPQWTAPEVLLRKPYRLSSDVYSYAIVLWELLMRKVPYQGKGLIEIVNSVTLKGNRPEIPSKLPDHVIPEFRDLMVASWAADPTMRPSMDQIVQRLQSMPID